MTWKEEWLLGAFKTEANRNACVRLVSELATLGVGLLAEPAVQSTLTAWFRATTPAFAESMVDSVRLHDGILVSGVKSGVRSLTRRDQRIAASRSSTEMEANVVAESDIA